MNVEYWRGEEDRFSTSETVRTSWAAETCLGRACCSVLPPRAAVYKWAKIYRNPLGAGERLLKGASLRREIMDQGMRLEHGSPVPVRPRHP